MRAWFVLAAAAVVASCSAGAPAGDSSASETARTAGTAETTAATRSLAPPASADDSLAAAEAFLETNGARDGVITTASGLQYEVLASGPADGVSPTPGQVVCVHYRGTFLDGSEFDSSYSRGQAASFESNRVIAGWVEALGMMKPGDAWRLYIHPDLAYGPEGRPGIPPNAALLFDVSLIKLLDGPAPRGVDCAAG